MNNIWREVIERAADTLDDLGAPLNADELRRLTTAGQQAAGVSEEMAKRAISARNEYLDLHPGDALGGMKAALTTAGAAPEGMTECGHSKYDPCRNCDAQQPGAQHGQEGRE